MQKKKINKVLIAAVALIWGVVVYKFASPYFTTSDAVVTADVLVRPVQSFLRKKDTFNLTKVVRDPFLGKISSVKKRIPAVSSNKKKKRVASKSSISKSWPKIEYLGFIKPKEGSAKLGLVRINGMLKRVRKGADVKGVKIVNIKEDIVTIGFQKDRKDFRKVN